jgi:phosphoenolpyruvate carboxylase
MLPAWLGTDEAFNENLDGKNLHILNEMIEQWPFFQSQLEMLEMVLSKANTDIARHYDEEFVEAELQPLAEGIRKRLRTLVDNINKMKNQESLLEKSPGIRRSLELRNTYTDALHFLQIELISRCRQSQGEPGKKVEKALLVTIAGIAASMRNTG